MRFYKKNISLLIILLILAAISACKEQAVNWYPSFDSTDKIPFGTFVLRNELDSIFPDAYIENIKEPTINFFADNYNSYDDYYEVNGCYLHFYNKNQHDTSTWREILNFVSLGNCAFVSQQEFYDSVLQMINVEIDLIQPKTKDEVYISLSTLNPKNSQNQIKLKKGVSTHYFSSYNEKYTEILGHVEVNGTKKPNFIRFQHFDGFLYLHAEPFAFTNYHMLKEDHYKYVVNALSYTDSYTYYWDNHRMYGRRVYGEQEGGFFSSLSFVIEHKALRYALLCFVAMGILYVLFNYKRKQKAIPVLHGYKNYSLDFAKTISLLYQKSPNHRALLLHKVNYFLDQIRTKYNLPTHTLDEEFAETVSKKSGVEIHLCKDLVRLLNKIKQSEINDREHFYTLHDKIESFYKQAN